ncbi:hypothetical protein HDU91_003755, partial [Kappamyces sp. JEL0680]
RFYLTASPLEKDPKKILVTCLFLATKIEHHVVPLGEFLAKIPRSPSTAEIIDLELDVSREIKFEFMMHHPYWPLHGFFLDIQVYIEQVLAADKRQAALHNLLQCYSAAALLVPKALLTDLVFLAAPSQIALACLWAAAATEFSLKDYMEWRFASVQDLSHRILSYTPIDKELAKILVGLHC